LTIKNLLTSINKTYTSLIVEKFGIKFEYLYLKLETMKTKAKIDEVRKAKQGKKIKGLDQSLLNLGIKTPSEYEQIIRYF
jgi:hypothetical protein